MEIEEIVFVSVFSVGVLVYAMTLVFAWGFKAGVRQTDRKWIRLTQEVTEK